MVALADLYIIEWIIVLGEDLRSLCALLVLLRTGLDHVQRILSGPNLLIQSQMFKCQESPFYIISALYAFNRDMIGNGGERDEAGRTTKDPDLTSTLVH